MTEDDILFVVRPVRRPTAGRKDKRHKAKTVIAHRPIGGEGLTPINPSCGFTTRKAGHDLVFRCNRRPALNLLISARIADYLAQESEFFPKNEAFFIPVDRSGRCP